MDEHPAAGVFFGNNSVLSGAAGGPGLGGRILPPPPAQQQQQQQQQLGVESEAQRPQYNIPGILHFLQHEWARFEVERTQWEVDRAELQAQISFLQGERKGQENLKKDLVRRIKMLEYALKQERAKHHKLKYGTELNQGDMKPPNYDSDEGNENEIQTTQNNQLTWKQGRQLLRQYLQEVGYTDTIIDVKSRRARALLGLTGDDPDKLSENKSLESVINGGETLLKRTDMIGNSGEKVKPLLTDSADVLETFKFLENAAAVFSDEDDDDESDGKEQTIIDTSFDKVAPSNAIEDMDTVEALREFDFLGTTEDGEEAGESRSAGDGTEWDKEDVCPTPESWDVDQGLITKLKEQYKKERKGKKGVKRPNRSKLQDMLATLRDVDELPPLQSSVNSPPRPISTRLTEHETGRTEEVEALTFPPGSGKSFIMGTDEALENALGLGELAGLTVANEADPLNYDIANNKDALRKTWNPKFTLRSHFDGIRGLAFHPVEPVLVTASEDHTVKLWNLQKTTPAKKSTSLDVEPIYTFRAHRGPVLCVVMSTSGEQCFSGGTDGLIQCWNAPSSNVDPYDSYDPSVLRGALEGHSDAIWGLVYSAAHQRLLSGSADGTLRLWNTTEIAPSLCVINENKECGIPTSVDIVCSDPSHLVSSFVNGQTSIFDMETCQRFLTFESSIDASSTCQINKVISHPTLPVTITAHEDRYIKFFDNNTGKILHSMVAHLDAVTSLAVDPNGLYLMSGSHDSSIRLWSLETKTCIQEFTAHRKKFDESIHDVAFHPSKCYIASAGADALAKVFV
ncbi:striatin isoform X2 [Amblyraja radiata]|uniref:striatin isoform X2 n=1 Tax=Amblyraja radiata TaxID=386614 RepID=UPI001403E9D2|nr:striatin isoform X2 [Amblyraja radiata]